MTRIFRAWTGCIRSIRVIRVQKNIYIEIMIYRSKESYNITGAAMHVYNVLGSGFLEAVYQEALAIEFAKRGIPFEREKELKVFYDGHELKQTYRADFVCYGDIILELKAV